MKKKPSNPKNVTLESLAGMIIDLTNIVKQNSVDIKENTSNIKQNSKTIASLTRLTEQNTKDLENLAIITQNGFNEAEKRSASTDKEIRIMKNITFTKAHSEIEHLRDYVLQIDTRLSKVEKSI